MGERMKSDVEALKQAMMLQSQLDRELKFEFLKYLDSIKMEYHIATTTSNLKRQIKAAVQALPGVPFNKRSV